MGQKSNWAIGLFGAGVGVVVAAVVGAAAIVTPPSSPWSSSWFIVLICGGGGLLVLAAALEVGALQECPKLVFGEPFGDLRHISTGEKPVDPGEAAYQTRPASVVFTIATTHVAPDYPTGWFVYVPVENRPKRGDQDAANVRARLTFSNQAGARIAEMHGRWAETDMGGFRDQILRAPEVPLPANGNPRLLDVAFRPTGENEWFAMNDENVGYPMLRHRRLDGLPVGVHIEVRGSGCRAAADFELTSNGKLIRR